jgi:type IV pilus assembly protein PilC
MSNPESTTGAAKRPRRTRRRGGGPSPNATGDAGAASSSLDQPVASGPATRGGLLISDRVPQKDVTQFMRQLIMLLQAGTPLLRSLKSLGERSSKPAVRRLVSDIAEYVEGGNALWQAFERHPRCFNSVEVNLIRASEASGTLLAVMDQLVTYRERRRMLVKKVQSAMLYPVILIVACLAVALVISIVVVPEFKALFDRMGIQPEGFSAFVLQAVEAFGTWWWVGIIALFAVALLVWLWANSTSVNRLRAHRLTLRVPILGRIVRKYSMVQMTRTLSLLLRSGLSMMVSLDLTRRAIYNQAIAQTLQDVRNNVEGGGSIEEPLRRHRNLIDPVVVDMLVTGEESGQLDLIAEQIARVYEEEVNVEVNTLGESLQPVLVIIIGGMVGSLFIALFMPMISMLEQLQSQSGGI